MYSYFKKCLKVEGEGDQNCHMQNAEGGQGVRKTVWLADEEATDELIAGSTVVGVKASLKETEEGEGMDKSVKKSGGKGKTRKRELTLGVNWM